MVTYKVTGSSQAELYRLMGSLFDHLANFNLSSTLVALVNNLHAQITVDNDIPDDQLEHLGLEKMLV